MNKAWILWLNTLLPLSWLHGPVNVKQSFNLAPVDPEPTRNVQWLLAVSCETTTPPVKFLVCVTNVAIKSFSDPGGQLRVAARRPESTIVNPDGGRSQLLQCDRGGANWGRVAVQLIKGLNIPNWINMLVHMVTSWYWYLLQWSLLSAEGQ